jgi:hypothetical protein
VEEDQLTVTLRMLAEGQQMLTDVLSQLDKLPAERTVKVNVVSDTGAGGISGASDQVQSDVASMNKSMETMPAVAEQTSAKVSSSMGSKGMGGAFSETRGNLNSLTGGMMGFLPLMAGMSLVSATGQFDALAKSVQQFKVMSDTSAEDASKWVGVANIYGLSTNSLSMAMKGLEQHQESLQTTFNKTTGSGIAASIALDNVKKANEELDVATQKIATDQQKANDAIAKYGKNSIQAQTAEQSLETAQAHRLSSQAGLLRAQDEYNKATGQTNNQLSTVQLAAQRLGITLVNNKGQMTSQTQILMEMADAYTRTGGSVQTVADITAILGGRAKALLPMFAQGSQGIQDAMQQTANAGLVMSQSQLSVGVATGKLMNDIKENIKSLFVGIGQFLIPVFDFVDQHIHVFVDLGGAVLGVVAAIKLIKFGTGIVHDAEKIIKAMTGASAASTLTSPSGATGKIIGATVTVGIFGPEAMEQLKMVGGLGGGGGGIPGGLNATEKDVGKLTGGAGFLQMLGRIPGIGGMFGGAAAGTAEAGGLGSGLAGGIGIGTGATAGVFAAALAPALLMFLNTNYTNSQKGDKAGATTGPTSGLFTIPGMTSAIAVGGGAFKNFFDAVHQNTTYTTVMGKKIASVSDNMHDVQGLADMKGFFYDISKMKGFSGMTVTQQEALMNAVQSGAVGSQTDMETWLANNHIIAASAKTAAANAASFSQQMLTLSQTATQTGSSLQGNLQNLADEMKDTSGSTVNTAIEARNIAALYKNHTVKTQAQVSAVQGMYTNIANATGGSDQAQALLERSLNDGQLKVGGSVQSTIDAWKILVDEGAKPATASAIQVAEAYKLAAADAALLHANLQQDNNIPGVTLPNGKVIKYATGGLINEHIVGIGQKSGTQYHFGEAGNEAVIPMSGASGGEAAQPVSIGSSGGGGGDVMIVHVSFPNSLTFLNNANQIDELSKAIESRLATVRLPHRGVRLSPHATLRYTNPMEYRSTLMLHSANRSLGSASADHTVDYA